MDRIYWLAYICEVVMMSILYVINMAEQAGKDVQIFDCA